MNPLFGNLTQVEKLAFWQDIAEKLYQALELCQDQINAGMMYEIREYIEHNELGLAWETLCDALDETDEIPPNAAQVLILETGKRMGLRPLSISQNKRKTAQND